MSPPGLTSRITDAETAAARQLSANIAICRALAEVHIFSNQLLAKRITAFGVFKLTIATGPAKIKPEPLAWRPQLMVIL